MCDVGRTDYDAFLPADESLVKLIRIATYVPDIDKAIHLGKHVKAMGYDVSVNIMAVSHALEPDLDEALDQLAETNFDMVYIVDSFGYFYSEQIHWLVEKYMTRLPGKQIGIHCHNNQQLAFANTIEGIIKGANYLDGTVFGIGRAAGNCPLELLLGFLKNPKFDIKPVLDLVEKHFAEMKKELRWGYELPYAVTGILNKHPRAAMAFLKGVHGNTCSEFYDELLNVDDVVASARAHRARGGIRLFTGRCPAGHRQNVWSRIAARQKPLAMRRFRPATHPRAKRVIGERER